MARSRKAPCGDRDGRRRILRVLRETGGRKRSVLDALAGGDRKVLDKLLEERAVVMRSDRRGATYEIPGARYGAA